jgi:hypothetical protein
VTIVEQPGGAPFWALPNEWDRERFQLHKPRTFRLAGVRQAPAIKGVKAPRT